MMANKTINSESTKRRVLCSFLIFSHAAPFRRPDYGVSLCIDRNYING